MKIRLTPGTTYQPDKDKDVVYQGGSVLDLPDESARHMIAGGSAVEVGQNAEPEKEG